MTFDGVVFFKCIQCGNFPVLLDDDILLMIPGDRGTVEEGWSLRHGLSRLLLVSPRCLILVLYESRHSQRHAIVD